MTFEAKHTNSDFYPRPPRGGRPLAVKNSCVHEAISIHALREEGDKDNSASFLPGEGFLSTPSARRATCQLYGLGRGGAISIHALREEGDRAFLLTTESRW